MKDIEDGNRAMGTEIERKYLVDPEAFMASGLAEDAERTRIEQGYIAVGGGMFDEMRIRISDGQKATFTRKSKGDLAREENEFAISVERAQVLLGACEGRVLDKTRYRVPANDGLVFEVDIYAGDLEGLAVAEVEIPNENTTIDLPAWIGQEVTFNKAYKNAQLALHGKPIGSEARRKTKGP